MKKLPIIVLILLSIAVVFCGCNSRGSVDGEITSYNVTATLDLEAATLTCSQRVNYINDSADGLSEIRFNLYPAAFREDAKLSPVTDEHIGMAYYDGTSFGNVTITNVAYNSQSTDYEVIGVDKTLLSVKTVEELKGGESAVVSIDYTVNLPKTHTRFGITKSGANLCNFYPVVCPYENGAFREAPYYAVGDPFYSEVANYNVTMFYPSSGIMAATGSECEKYVENGVACSVYSAENVRDFAAVFLSGGKIISDRSGKTDINYYYTADGSPDVSLSAGKKAFETYQSLFGVYPYSTFNVVDTDFIYGGMEYPCLILINNKLTGFNREYTIAHETAHQWWYGLVGSDSVSCAWQDEGLTEFSTALYFKHTGREKLFNSIISNAYDTYVYAFEVLNKVEEFDGIMRRAVYEYNNEAAYVITAYDKGMLMNNCLYNLLGEKAFLTACRNYLDDNRYKIATAENFVSSFPDCAPLINCWLDGKVLIGGTNYT